MTDPRRTVDASARTAGRGGLGRSAPGRRPPRPGRAGRRAVVPAIGKALEASVVVLFLTVLTTALFGGVVPDYRTAAGDELADRTLSTAAHRVQDAVGPNATVARARVRVELPATIRGTNYRITVDGDHLVLVHPDPGIGGRTPLAVPGHVVAVEGTWHSHEETVVVVEPAGDGVRVRLASVDGGGGS